MVSMRYHNYVVADFEHLVKLLPPAPLRPRCVQRRPAPLLQTWIARIFRIVLFGFYILSILSITVNKAGRHEQFLSLRGPFGTGRTHGQSKAD
jgi:hypothetical protein